MAYTTLPTQSAGQTASAAGWANVVKANFDAMGPHLIARKTSDETDSTGTLQNDDILFTPSIPANEVWELEWNLICVSASSGNFQMAATFPSGTFSGTVYTLSTNSMMSGTSSPTSTMSGDINTSAAGQIIKVSGKLVNAGTPGAVTLQWCRQTSGSFTVKAQSTLWGVKLA